MNLRFWKKQEIYGTTISEAAGSSQVSDNSLYYQYVRPEVDFKTCYEYYRTIGRVQNAVESYVSQVLSRDWYFEGPQDAVRQLEEWEDRFNLSRLLEYMVRDWLVCGNSILGVSDWQPVQVSSIIGMKRNQYGMPEQFVQQVNGREVALDASKFVHTQYIELNREAWGVGMFHSLLTTFDYGSKKRSLPQLEIYRRQIQLFYKVLERYGSPVTVWFFDNVSKAEFDKQVEELRALEAGDRRILSKKVEIATETIDGRGNLINATSPFINQEIEAGLQTSANRLITQPSAMADAKSAGEKDDVRGLLIAEKIRRVMNVLIIPKLTSSRVEFKWGKQDSFEFDFGQLLQAKSAGFVSAEEGRAILQSVGWKLDDQLFSQQGQQLQKQEDFRFLEEAPSQLLTEHNDCHDSSGRFCSGGGSGAKRSGSGHSNSNRSTHNSSAQGKVKQGNSLNAMIAKDGSNQGKGEVYVKEKILVSDQPLEEHKSIGMKIASEHLGIHNENFYTEQAWKADQIRARDEEYANKLLDNLKKDHPDADVVGRLKDRTSMIEKLAYRPEKYKDVSEIQDTVGMRIVSPQGIDGVKETATNLKSNYNVIQEKNLIDKPTSLGYRGYHLTIKDPNTGIESEMQVRTHNQDVWASYAHDKIYKTDDKYKRVIQENKKVVHRYAKQMSDYFYDLDNNKINVNKPPCPDVIRKYLGCMEE